MEDIPKKTAGDYVHSALKGALSAVPIAGGPLAVLFETVFSAPIDRRKEEWSSSLATAIQELIEKTGALSPQKLSENETFISVAMQATQIALRNHQKEKIAALRNAVMNSVLQTSVDENKALIFTRIIDEITPLHISVLSFLDNPEAYERKLQARERPNTSVHYPGNINVWEEYYPELKTSSSLVEQVVKELYAKGFVFRESMHSGKGRVTTKFGQEFLAFISSANET